MKPLFRTLSLTLALCCGNQPVTVPADAAGTRAATVRVETPAGRLANPNNQTPMNVPDDSYTPLMTAAMSGVVDKVNSAIASGADLNAGNAKGETALMLAAGSGGVDAVKVLVAAGANVGATTQTGATALHYAATSGQTDIVQVLLDKGAKVDAKDLAGWTPLMLAASLGHVEVCSMLLDRGADINAVSVTPSSALGSQPDDPGTTVDELHQSMVDWHHAKVAARNEATLLTVASVVMSAEATAASYQAAVRSGSSYYTQYNPTWFTPGSTYLNVDSPQTRNRQALYSCYGRTALHYAVLADSLATVQLLVQRGAVLDAKDDSGASPFAISIKYRFNDIALFLLSRSAAPMTLSLSVRFGTDADVSTMIASGGDVNGRDEFGFTPLQYAAQEGRTAVIAELLDKGADINALGASYAVSALWFATSANQMASVSALLDRGAQILVPKQATDPFLTAVEGGHVDIAKVMIEHGANISQYRGLMVAGVASGNPDMIDLLLQDNVSVTENDSLGKSPLYHASGDDDAPIVSRLLDKGAQVTPDALQLAARHGRLAVFDVLIDRADATMMDKLWGRGHVLLLHAAAEGGNADIIRALISKGGNGDINVKDSAFHRTPLQYAVSGGFADAVQTLLSSGADANVQDQANQTPLHYAILAGDLEMVKILVDGGAKLSTDSYVALAVHQNWADMVQFLLDKGADIKATDNKGDPPINIAIRNDNTQIIDVLLAKDPSLSTADPLHRLMQYALDHHRGRAVNYFVEKYPTFACINSAALDGGTADVQRFLDDKADVDSGSGTAAATALHAAAICGSIPTVNLLLSRHANVNATDDAGLTPLHTAILEGRTAIAALLIDNGADVNARDMIGANPLQWAAYFGNVTVATALVAKHADVNNKTADGYTPMLRAAQTGNVAMIRLLGTNGANLNQKGPDGFTPLQIAQMKHYPEAVSAINDLLNSTDKRGH